MAPASLINRLRSFARDSRGNVAAIFAMTVTPVIVATGAAMDYSAATSTRQVLDRAADTAALAGSRAASTSDRKTIATNTFTSLASAAPGAKIASLVVDVSGTNTVSVKYSADVMTTLMSYTGLKKMTVAGAAQAVSENSGFADYYILVDTSASMGMGATAADTTKMISLIGCALACHYNGGNASDDTYPKVHAAGINTRLDAAKNAIVNLITTLNSSQAKTGNFRVGIYPFVKKMKTLYALSTNLPGAINAVTAAEPGGLHLDSADTSYGSGGTDIETPLASLNAILPKSGDGSSSSSPRVYVLLVTDGLYDAQDWNPSTRTETNDADNSTRIHAFNSAACAPIKNKGIALGVLNAKYTKITGPTTDAKQDQVANSAIPSLAPALSNCASDPSMYFEATYSGEIDSAFQAYATGTFVASTRFTQ